jgi:hypothetical protein
MLRKGPATQARQFRGGTYSVRPVCPATASAAPQKRMQAMVIAGARLRGRLRVFCSRVQRPLLQCRPTTGDPTCHFKRLAYERPRPPLRIDSPRFGCRFPQLPQLQKLSPNQAFGPEALSESPGGRLVQGLKMCTCQQRRAFATQGFKSIV